MSYKEKVNSKTGAYEDRAGYSGGKDTYIPRTEFLLHDVKQIEEALIAWCKKKYSQGDDYSVRVTSKGKWAVSYSNDYPMQHGSGKEFVLTEEEFKEAMQTKIIIEH